MARKCPDCGHVNDDEMSFCTECGEPLDPQVRLVMELEGKKAPTSYTGTRKNSTEAIRMESHSRYNGDDDEEDDDYTPLYQEEKKFPVGLIFVLAAVAAALYFFLR